LNAPRIVIDPHPPRPWLETVEGGLRNYNTAATGIVDLYLVGFIIKDATDAIAGGLLGDIAGFLSFESRFEGFARGLIDTRAIVYFLSISVVCLLVAFRSLESRKWS